MPSPASWARCWRCGGTGAPPPQAQRNAAIIERTMAPIFARLSVTRPIVKRPPVHVNPAPCHLRCKRLHTVSLVAEKHFHHRDTDTQRHREGDKDKDKETKTKRQRQRDKDKEDRIEKFSLMSSLYLCISVSLCLCGLLVFCSRQWPLQCQSSWSILHEGSVPSILAAGLS